MSNYPNMSYCQFENTAAAMKQVMQTIDDHIEERGSLDDFEDFLSRHENNGYKKLIHLCESLGDG